MTLLYNIGIAILEMAYAFSIAVAMDALMVRGKVSNEISRKVIHLWMGGLIVFWFLYTAQYGEYLFLVTPLIWVGIMLHSMSPKSHYKATVKRFTRRNNINEVVYGPLIFFMMFIVVTIIAFRSLGGVAALCAMVFGDGVAPLVGRHANKHYLGGKKSIEGSIAVFAASFLSTVAVFAYLFPAAPAKLFYAAAATSVVAALVEALTPRNYDNLTVPIFVLAAFAVLLS